MSKIFKFSFFLTMLLLVNSVSYAFYTHAETKEGDVIYSFECGKMQCLSEIDHKGHIWVVLKSLNSNTTVNFNKVEKLDKDSILTFTMFVEDTSKMCAAWINMQEVQIVLNPIKVKKTTFTAKKIYEKDGITVMQ